MAIAFLIVLAFMIVAVQEALLLTTISKDHSVIAAPPTTKRASNGGGTIKAEAGATTAAVLSIGLSAITRRTNLLCPTNSGMSDRLRRRSLNFHNYRRSQLAKGVVENVGVLLPPATNMVKLNYSCELETSAQQAAKSCSESASLPYGVQENFYLVAKNLAQCRMNATELAIKHWWSQVRLQSVNIGMAATLKEHHFGPPIMSFIRMAWAATTEFGCAVSEKEDCGSNWAVVCHYRTGPFRANMRVYTTGPTCSSCPASSSDCSNGLCVKKLPSILVTNHNCPTSFGIEDVIRSTALDMINYRRSQLAKGLVEKNNGNALSFATNMIKLVRVTEFQEKYSCRQERTAINVAKKCAESASLPDGVQENFLLVPKNLTQFPLKAVEIAIKYGWSQVEVSTANFGASPMLEPDHFSRPILSFIKMAWASTVEFGCAVSERELCGTKRAVVCHYKMGPFRANMRVYTTGQTCSSCRDTCENALCVK